MSVYTIKAVPGELGWTAQVLRDGVVVSQQHACPDERTALRTADWYRRNWAGWPHHDRQTLYIRVDGSVEDVLLPDEREDPPSMSGWQRNVEEERIRETM